MYCTAGGCLGVFLRRFVSLAKCVSIVCRSCIVLLFFPSSCRCNLGFLHDFVWDDAKSALHAYDEALKWNPNHVRSNYYKALLLKGSNDMAQVIAR